MQDFQQNYKALKDKGYSAGFLQAAIAHHCGRVSIHLVKRWISGETIRPCYVTLLETFSIDTYKWINNVLIIENR